VLTFILIGNPGYTCHWWGSTWSSFGRGACTPHWERKVRIFWSWFYYIYKLS